MAAGRAGQARASAPTLFSIGQVLAKLTPEFPDLTPSKLRFYEAEGLVAPARTESGYRKYSHEDIDRLRYVLVMIRDHYLPLKVIRVQLADYDTGRTDKLVTPKRLPGTILDTERRLTRADLLRETGATAPLLAEAASFKLLPAAEPYGEDSAVLLRALVDLQKVGLGPKNLSGFRAAAEREAGLVASAVEPVRRRPGSGSKERAAELSREIAARLELIRSALLRGALERVEH